MAQGGVFVKVERLLINQGMPVKPLQPPNLVTPPRRPVQVRDSRRRCMCRCSRGLAHEEAFKRVEGAVSVHSQVFDPLRARRNTELSINPIFLLQCVDFRIGFFSPQPLSCYPHPSPNHHLATHPDKGDAATI